VYSLELCTVLSCVYILGLCVQYRTVHTVYRTVCTVYRAVCTNENDVCNLEMGEQSRSVFIVNSGAVC
jgi:hypothetical protein